MKEGKGNKQCVDRWTFAIFLDERLYSSVLHVSNSLLRTNSFRKNVSTLFISSCGLIFDALQYKVVTVVLFILNVRNSPCS